MSETQPGRGEITFAPESAPRSAPAGPLLHVLVVDDDPEVHAVTRLMLTDFRYEGRKIGLLHAHSAAEAKQLLATHPNVALVLLDVVMETDRSGLDLVRYIREELKNSGIRIALRTGQPGQIPEHQIVAQYPIDDYVLKSELTYLRVQTLVTTTLRTFELVHKLERSQDELQRANRELERLAQTDPLTGLWNRRRFDEELDREWRRLIRERQSVVALMIDVDYFKAFNDTEGHPAGDRVLQAIAQVLLDTFRRGADMVCRYGGEEFLAVLPGTELSEGFQIADTIRTRVQALAFKHSGSPQGVVTASIGCSAAHPAHAGDAGLVVLIERADQALYRAKREGRNRVATLD